MIIWLVLAPITDIVISIALVRFLQSSKTGFAAMDDILTRITRVTIQTGAITAVWALIYLTFYLRYTNTLGLAFGIPMPKLYSNCLMSSLNARHYWSVNQGPSSVQISSGGKKELIHLTTTTTGVVQDTYELDTRSGAFDGNASTNGTASAKYVIRKAAGEGLSVGSNDSLKPRMVLRR